MGYLIIGGMVLIVIGFAEFAIYVMRRENESF
jgi:hypothetical protein